MESTMRARLSAARQGKVPAEVLSPEARHRLVREWHAKGLTDVDMARRSAWSTYTVARIREQLGLTANTLAREK